MKYNRLSILIASLLAIGCSDNTVDIAGDIIDLDDPVVTEKSEDYYAGGLLGTTTMINAYAYQQPTPAVEFSNMQMEFQNGETLFERDYNQNTDGAFTGLGPVYVRKGCLYCHPNYGHGKRQTRYRESDMGNGYLLVIFDKTNDAYIRSVAGMPQTGAVAPFKAPIDENQIKIDWLAYTDEWGNRFPDGETYSLIYPEVTIPQSAYYAPIMVQRNGQDIEVGVDEIAVRLESTIGLYGTGLTDAIPDDSITAQWQKESAFCTLNPAMWDQTTNMWKSYYTNAKQGDGTKYVRRYTYAMSRGPLLDAAGANAIWNITNVTRSDRRYHYLDLAGKYYATKSSKDPDVQREFYTYFPEWNKTGDVEKDIYDYLTSAELPIEMTDQQYKNLMIWHRGLAVPAARNTGTDKFKKGKELFSRIGCASCHRPSWTTGDDHIQDPAKFFKSDNDMPRYPNQKIWPYSDFVQHRLFMVNDIRTGWCRTTPLWGRGLSMLCTGASDRLHDCRARTTMEAIMWHGSAQSDARWTIELFRNLSKEERDAIIFFCESV